MVTRPPAEKQIGIPISVEVSRRHEPWAGSVGHGRLEGSVSLAQQDGLVIGDQVRLAIAVEVGGQQPVGGIGNRNPSTPWLPLPLQSGMQRLHKRFVRYRAYS